MAEVQQLDFQWRKQIKTTKRESDNATIFRPTKVAFTLKRTY